MQATLQALERGQLLGQSYFFHLMPEGSPVSVLATVRDTRQCACVCLPFRLHRASQAAKGQSKITDGCRLLTVHILLNDTFSCGIHELKEITKKWLMLISKCRSGDEHHHEDRTACLIALIFDSFLLRSQVHWTMMWGIVNEQTVLRLCCYESYF